MAGSEVSRVRRVDGIAELARIAAHPVARVDGPVAARERRGVSSEVGRQFGDGLVAGGDDARVPVKCPDQVEHPGPDVAGRVEGAQVHGGS